MSIDPTATHGPPQGPWREGWHRDARAVPSPNFGPRPPGTAIDLAVVHSISLPPGRYGGDEVERLFTNTLDGTPTHISTSSAARKSRRIS